MSYLQPFEAGNTRTSRLSANLLLLRSNCAPLSFLDVVGAVAITAPQQTYSTVTVFDGHADHLSEVVLTLRVVGTQLAQVAARQ